MNTPDIEIQENLRLQQLIVEDIQRRTGVTIPNLSMAKAAVEDPECAALIYPILLAWLERPITQDIRFAIQDVFHLQNANPYLGDMLDWMRAEPLHLHKGTLRTLIARVMQPSQHEMVWRAIVEDGPSNNDYDLLPKLAKCTQINSEVIERIQSDISSGRLDAWELGQAAKVDDARIRELILAKADDPDPQIRRVARRLAARKTAFPKGLRRSTTPPWRQFELYSAEVDVSELGRVLTELAAIFEVEVPRVCRNGRFTEHMEVDQWVWIPVGPKTSGGFELWFRLEDVDVVEVVLLHASERSEEPRREGKAN